MQRPTIHVSLILVIALLAAPIVPATSSAASTQQLRIRALERQVGTLKRQRTRLFVQRNAAVRSRNQLTGQLRATTEAAQALQRLADTLIIEKATLQKVVAALNADNMNLRAGLPDAILAVPIEDFPRLVFNPARQKWPCDSFFQSGSYWSYSFDSSC